MLLRALIACAHVLRVTFPILDNVFFYVIICPLRHKNMSGAEPKRMFVFDFRVYFISHCLKAF
jgi:hypothetical protein